MSERKYIIIEKWREKKVNKKRWVCEKSLCKLRWNEWIMENGFISCDFGPCNQHNY